MELTTPQICEILNIPKGTASKAGFRWLSKLGISGEKKKQANGGYVCRHYSQDEVERIIAFEKELAANPRKRYVRVIPIDKINQAPSQKTLARENIERGLYPRLTRYGGSYDARKWTVENKREGVS